MCTSNLLFLPDPCAAVTSKFPQCDINNVYISLCVKALLLHNNLISCCLALEYRRCEDLFVVSYWLWARLCQGHLHFIRPIFTKGDSLHWGIYVQFFYDLFPTFYHLKKFKLIDRCDFFSCLIYFFKYSYNTHLNTAEFFLTVRKYKSLR